MKRFLTLTLAVCLLAVCLTPRAFADIEGSWTANTYKNDVKRPDRIHFNITRGATHNMGQTFQLSTFTGLTREQIDATTMTPVTFEMRREAGNITYEGTFRNGNGAGQFTFAPNRNYVNTVRSMGLTFDLGHRRKAKERSEEEDLFQLALFDVSTAFIKQMQSEGFKTTLDKYLQMRIFDITPEYIREMRSLGFKDLDEDDLVTSKIHKVTPQYVRDMRAAGWDLSLQDLQSSAIHGATPQFAAEMKKLGYSLDFDDLVSFRIHRVTAEFINELRELGYDHVSANDLVSMRIHRVTPEFIRELRAAGYKNVPIEKMVAMRIHNIDAEYLKRMGDS